MHFHYTAGVLLHAAFASVSFLIYSFPANALIYGAKRWFLINPEQALYVTDNLRSQTLLLSGFYCSSGHGMCLMVTSGTAASTHLLGLPRTSQSFGSK